MDRELVWARERSYDPEHTTLDHRRNVLFALLPDQSVKPTQHLGLLSHAGVEILRWLERRRHYHHRAASDVVIQAAGDLYSPIDVRAVGCELDSWSWLCCFLDVVPPVDSSIRAR